MPCKPAQESPVLRQPIEITGNVHLADGRPATKATVLAKAGESNPIYLENGQPKSGYDESLVAAMTDDTGDFRLTVTSPLFTLLVLHEAGTQIVPHDQYVRSDSIYLDAWARIDGVAGAGAESLAERKILMNAGHFPGTDGPHLLWQADTRTDAEGRFAFDRVPARFEGEIRRVMTGPDGKETWGVSAGFVTAPGGNYSLSLGGREVVGRLDLPRARKNLRVSARIGAQRSTRPTPEGFEQMSAAEQWAWERFWWNCSDEGKQLRRLGSVYTCVRVEDDGRFRIEDVPVGLPLELVVEIDRPTSSVIADWIRRLRGRLERPADCLTRRFELPDSGDEISEPFDFGMVRLSAT